LVEKFFLVAIWLHRWLTTEVTRWSKISSSKVVGDLNALKRIGDDLKLCVGAGQDGN